MLIESVFLGLLLAFSTASPIQKRDAGTLEEALCFSEHSNVTPLETPVFPLRKKPERKPQDYLQPYEKPFGLEVAKLQDEFFGRRSPFGDPAHITQPLYAPKHKNAPTIITLFYPNAKAREGQNMDVYMRSIERLAKMGDQVIFYAEPGEIADTIRAMRPGSWQESHWLVIDEYPTVWDIPTNKFQRKNFEETQPKLYAKFKEVVNSDWKPKEVYNQPFLSAVYNAKTFCVYDAVMRNPWGSDLWMYADSGLWKEEGPLGANGQQWGMLFESGPGTAGGYVDWRKIQRAVTAQTGDTGVVFAEYPNNVARHGSRDATHGCWSDQRKLWQCKFFMAGIFSGSSIGMLRYSTRYMATVDAMEANDMYVGREEFVIPTVAYRYPNTVYSIPVQESSIPEVINDPHYGSLAMLQGKYVTLSYAKSFPGLLPRIDDPLATRMCGKHTQYKPRRPSLEQGEWA